jgi:hypothetical protein
MIQQTKTQNERVAQADPMLRFAELLVKINKREKVVEVSTEGQGNESDQRSSDNASQAE